MDIRIEIDETQMEVRPGSRVLSELPAPPAPHGDRRGDVARQR